MTLPKKKLLLRPCRRTSRAQGVAINQVSFSKSARKRLRDLARRLTRQEQVAREVATWSTEHGWISVDVEGYHVISAMAAELRKNRALVTYPVDYLCTLIAHTLINVSENGELVGEVISKLQDEYGRQKAFVPFWGLHIEEGVELSFGPYLLKTLGKIGFAQEIVEPFSQMRLELGEEQVAEDIATISTDYVHITNVPVLMVEFEGASEGAKDFVSPLAERVADALQFLVAELVRSRDHIHIVDHRGTYFGRLDSHMPVLSRSLDGKVLTRLDGPNLRGFPYGPVLKISNVDRLRSIGVLDILSAVPEGPSGSDQVADMLLRAIQLFADGERAVSHRQAVIAYVGACEVLFGKQDAAERYTCTGIALVLGGDFKKAYKLALELYDARSNAAHRGITPSGVGQARRVGYSCIIYVIENKTTLTSKAAIRAWLQPHVPKRPSAFVRTVWRLAGFINGVRQKLKVSSLNGS